MIKDTPDGQTHYEDDGCGEPEHNNRKPSSRKEKVRKDIERKYADVGIYDVTMNERTELNMIWEILDEMHLKHTLLRKEHNRHIGEHLGIIEGVTCCGNTVSGACQGECAEYKRTGIGSWEE